ncbi:hypothetical protein J6590_069668, partial [Homalodisca vitripennis]
TTRCEYDAYSDDLVSITVTSTGQRSGRQDTNHSCRQELLSPGELFQLVLRSKVRTARRKVDCYSSKTLITEPLAQQKAIRALTL